MVKHGCGYIDHDTTWLNIYVGILTMVCWHGQPCYGAMVEVVLMVVDGYEGLKAIVLFRFR